MKKLAHNKALKLNDSVSWNAYRNARNFANMKIKTYKMKFLEDQSQVCAKSFWKQIGYINGKSNSISNCCLVDHDVNDINDYFLSVPMNTIKGIATDLNAIPPTLYLNNISSPDFNFEVFEEVEIDRLLRDLDASKATGNYGIPAVLFKDLHSFFSKPITCIINNSLRSGIVPQTWKLAIITPIQKKKNASNMTDYRPISVLPVLSKILERAVQYQVVDHLLQHDLLSPYQSGFRPGLS